MSNNVEEPDIGGTSTPPTRSLPEIAAVFLVVFDSRKGYTLAWQKSIEELSIEGVVEFKSMPSGLHNVKEDLVYFVHEDYVGVSAVLNVEDEAAARKARIIAAGVLVPLEHGRMGKSWLHADNLKELAEKHIKNEHDFFDFEQYWEDHKVSEAVSEEGDTSKKDDISIGTTSNSKVQGYQSTRSMSIGTIRPGIGHGLPAHHPALALSDLLHLFGPLTFPLVRAALLRKRILFLGDAPVENACNYVYNLSILASLPKPIATLIPDLNPSNARIRPLLSIGVSDISLLEAENKSSGGWIACTTDDVLCTKPALFDILVVLPGSEAMSQMTTSRNYPRIYESNPDMSKARPRQAIRATQRDAKRFANLWKGLQTIPPSYKEDTSMSDSVAVESSPDTSQSPLPVDDSAETASVASSVSSTLSMKSVIEPQSWSRIAYTSIIWWASAGDKRAGLTELEEHENEQDVALLTGQGLEDDGGDDDDDGSRTREVACVQYFQRLSNLMFTTVREVIGRNDGYERPDTDGNGQDAGEHEGQEARLLEPSGDETGSEDRAIEFAEEDTQSMGLDAWSASDRQFIEELVKFWWNRKADVQGGRIECCGVRLM